MAAPKINEFVFNHTGTDTNEFVEILGDPSTNLNNYWLLQIEGDAGATGTIDRATQLGTTDANGLWTTGFLNNAYENGGVTLLLVQNFTGAVGQDIDTNDDGTIDNAPWSAIIDTVAVSDGGAGDRTYGTTVLDTVFGGGFAPGGASRIPNGADTDAVADWTVNDFDGAGLPGFTGTPVAGEALNTPGAANALAGGGSGGTPTDATIAEIQGASHLSSFDGDLVATSGIVTAVISNGFYLQDPNPDANDATSEGIFVFTSSAPTVAVGDAVEVEGTVDEFIPGGAATGNLSTTEIVSPTVTVISSGNALPDAIVLGAAGRNPPTELIDDDALATFDPATDGLDFYEALEGMRVTIDNAKAVSPTNGFGEIYTVPDNGANATGLNDRGGITISETDYNPERIQIQLNNTLTPGFSPQVNVGDTLGDVTGVVGYNFGNFEVNATSVFTPTSAGLTKEVTTLTGSANQLTIASFNVLNLDPKVETTSAEVDDDIGNGQFAALAEQVVESLASPDIIALEEIQDNSGGDDDGVTDASVTYQTLIQAIADAGGPTYEFVEIAPEDGSSGGQPGGNIRVGFLYNPTRVDYIDGSAQALTDANLTDGDAFTVARLPLAADFEFNGEIVHVIANHLSSKGGGTPLFGQVQPAVNGSEDQRIAQAEVVNAYVDSLLATDPNAKVAVVGDMNEFDFEDALDVLKGGADPVLTNLASSLPGDEQYSYNFEGNSQQLDHILVSDALAAANAEYHIVHANSEFADQTSDHDPSVSRFTIEADAEPGNYRLQLLHASDFEGSVDIIERADDFAAIVDFLEDQEANTITLSSGDNYIPGPFFNASGDPSVSAALQSVYTQLYGAAAASTVTDFGRADITLLNILGIDASAMGNHEFDAGTSVIRGMINPAATWPGIQFPYLSANLDFSADTNLASLYTSEIRPAESYDSPPGAVAPAGGFKKIAPATIIEEGGELIGVVGATTPILELISSPGATQVKDPGSNTNDMAALATILQPVIDAVIAQGVDKVILVSHMQQIAFEKELIQLLHGVDIVVAGGSNTLMADADDDLLPGHTAAEGYPFVTTNADGDPALIVNTDGEYSYVGRLVVEFDNEGKLVLDSLDPEINGAYDASESTVEELWGNLTDPFASGTKGDLAREVLDAVDNVITTKDSVILGRTDVYLDGRRTEVRTEETNLGNLTADANLAVAKELDPTVLVSIKNGGGVRDSIGVVADVTPGNPAELPPQANPSAGKETGDISQLDIENSLRFNNALSLVTVTAAQLLLVAEHAVAAVAAGATPGQFPQIGGFAFSFDATRPVGDRILSLALIDEEGNPTQAIVENGELLADAPAAIRVVTLSFLLTGGDSYPFNTFIAANPAFANVVNLNTAGLAAGDATFAAAGTEQDALAEYLLDNYATTAYNQLDTAPVGDERIQNTAFREDTVLDGLEEPEPPEDLIIDGDNRNNVLAGGLGNDTINGKNGNDKLTGDAGNDTLIGGNGKDKLFGDAGDDRLFGDNDDDELDGGAGNDLLVAGNGKDKLVGGEGNDKLQGGSGDDKLTGGAGNDDLQGDSGDDQLAGDAGNDKLDGGSGDDKLDGGADSDILSGGSGKDRLAGGTGDDELEGGLGDDRLDGGDGDDQLAGGLGDDKLAGGAGDDELIGGLGDDELDGGAGNDTLFAGRGDDKLIGGDGDDQMIGDLGNDKLIGGDGGDTMSGGQGRDMFVFAEGSGVDTILDFNIRQDVIDLRDYDFANFRSLMSLAHQEGINTVIDLNADDGDQLILAGVAKHSLQSNDFVI